MGRRTGCAIRIEADLEFHGQVSVTAPAIPPMTPAASPFEFRASAPIVDLHHLSATRTVGSQPDLDS